MSNKKSNKPASKKSLGNQKSEMLVVVSSNSETRGFGVKTLSVDELSKHMQAFLNQMGSVLEKAPAVIGAFRFEEFEVNAEITGKGSLALLGTGGEAGASGGIKFVFRREP